MCMYRYACKLCPFDLKPILCALHNLNRTTNMSVVRARGRSYPDRGVKWVESWLIVMIHRFAKQSYCIRFQAPDLGSVYIR